MAATSGGAAAAHMDKSRMLKIGSAIFYGLSSFLIVVVNKVVLTTYKFPSFQVLGLGQMIATLIVLFVGKKLKFITFPSITWENGKKVWPLPVFYIGNLFLGLGGTQKLSLPMFVVLRRFSILFTMIGERLILKVRASLYIQLSVYMMIFGAIVAAIDDLSFELVGYTYVLVNNICTAGNGIMMKKKLDAKELGKYGLLFFNALFMFTPCLTVAAYTNELQLAYDYSGWSDPVFLFSFLSSSCMGFILMLSIVLCTQYNSALTTTIIGCLKNIFSTYVGMYIGGDYRFSWSNFIGLNISVIGSLIYSYLVFKQKETTTGSAPSHNTSLKLRELPLPLLNPVPTDHSLTKSVSQPALPTVLSSSSSGQYRGTGGAVSGVGTQGGGTGTGSTQGMMAHH